MALSRRRTDYVPKLKEADIERQCLDLLALDGWRSLKTDPVSDRATVNVIRSRLASISMPPHVRAEIVQIIDASVRGKGFGEKGMPDRLYIRYGYSLDSGLIFASGTYFEQRARFNEVMWIEWKRPKGTAAPHQIAWHTAERARGALVLLAGVDFPATFEGFTAWYRNSGLMRRAL